MAIGRWALITLGDNRQITTTSLVLQLFIHNHSAEYVNIYGKTSIFFLNQLPTDDCTAYRTPPLFRAKANNSKPVEQWESGMEEMERLLGSFLKFLQFSLGNQSTFAIRITCVMFSDR